jgi:UDP-N-acetylglucosamine:LPS N-acetylglucosamine transferase
MKKICLMASAGGHFEQLLMLRPLLEKYQGFIVTEKTKYNVKDKKNKNKIYYLMQLNRREISCIFFSIFDLFKSLYIFFKEKPDVIISHGSLVTIPMCIIGKVFKKKIVFIESFARINTPSSTGQLLYKFADQFYVQWEGMLKYYPKAIYKGGIY